MTKEQYHPEHTQATEPETKLPFLFEEPAPRLSVLLKHQKAWQLINNAAEMIKAGWEIRSRSTISYSMYEPGVGISKTDHYKVVVTTPPNTIIAGDYHDIAGTTAYMNPKLPWIIRTLKKIGIDTSPFASLWMEPRQRLAQEYELTHPQYWLLQEIVGAVDQDKLELLEFLQSGPSHEPEKLGQPGYLYCYIQDELRVVDAPALINHLTVLETEESPLPLAMTLYLSTGVIDELNCQVANNKPKDHQEVVLGFGKEGVAKLLELGGLPCADCESLPILEEYFPELREELTKKYELVELEEVMAQLPKTNQENAKQLASIKQQLVNHHDAANLNWDEILEELRVVPQRLITAKDLNPEQAKRIRQIKRMIDRANLPLPEVGFHDQSNSQKFTEHKKPKNPLLYLSLVSVALLAAATFLNHREKIATDKAE